MPTPKIKFLPLYKQHQRAWSFVPYNQHFKLIMDIDLNFLCIRRTIRYLLSTHHPSAKSIYNYTFDFYTFKSAMLVQVALDLRGFSLRVSRFTRHLYFFQKNSNYAIPSIYAVVSYHFGFQFLTANQNIMFQLFL